MYRRLVDLRLKSTVALSGLIVPRIPRTRSGISMWLCGYTSSCYGATYTTVRGGLV